MNDLGLLLATAGQPLLMERRRASALVARYAEARAPQDGGILTRGLRALGLKTTAAGDASKRPAAFAPRIAWAPEAQCRNGYAVLGEIAVIDVRGVLTSDGYYDWWEDTWFGGYVQIEASIAAARLDPLVKAILLRIDSPGGSADGAFELARVIREGRAAAGGKPIWAHTQWACSAAYGLASGCDRILSTAQGYTGSIGVLVLHVDESEWHAKIGLKIEAIESAPGKSAGSGWKPLDDATRADIQADVDQIATEFVETVVAGRGLTADAIRAQNARIFLARHADPARSAEKLGLIDGVASEREAFAALADALAAAAAPPVPSPSSGPGASRAKGSKTHLTAKEESMALKTKIAALRVKAEAGDENASETLTKIEEVLGDEEKSAEDKVSEIEELIAGSEADTEEDDGEAGEQSSGEAAAKTKGGKPKASANDGFAVLDLPEAKGREQLATTLGRKVAAGKLTVAEAKEMLAAAPKASRLADAMNGRDVSIGSGGGGKSKTGAASAVDSMRATLKAQGIKADA
jgi:signal peptide peptidase SppA